MARAWGFMGAGAFTLSTGNYRYHEPWFDPPMGRMPSNKMTFVITHNNSHGRNDRRARRTSTLQFCKVGAGPYFADPYDPKFQSSVRAVARTLAGHGKDPWVRYVGHR